MKEEESKLYKRLKRIVDNWSFIALRVFQDGKWRSLYLSEIKDERKILSWLTNVLVEALK